MLRYIDASLLVRSYLGDEAGSLAATSLLAEPDVESFSSELIDLEVRSAAEAACRHGRLPSTDRLLARFAHDSDPDGWLTLVPIGIDGIVAHAGRLAGRYGLRALDALHLATAELVATTMHVDQFATVDERLAGAARASGFQVVP